MNATPTSDQSLATVLVVDDTPATLSLLAKHLEEHGIQVAVAEEGEEAIQRAQIVRPDLVLLDVMMPGLDGFETCRRLKADEKTQDIPVIFMTALSDTQSKVAGFDAGGVDFVTKPVQLEEVLARVRTHLALRALQQKLEAQNNQLQREMVERKQAEDKVRQLNAELEGRIEERTAELAQSNRMLRVLSDCNQTVVRATAEPELLQEICRIIADLGGYPLAWVGFAEHDKALTVRPVAQSGEGANYLDTVLVSWSDCETAWSPAGMAIRTGKSCVVENILTDPKCGPWSENAIRHGFKSSLALPLCDDNGVFGALNIFASETDAFQSQEMGLLSELAGDLAYGIRSIRTQIARMQAEFAQRESEERYRALYEENPSMYFTLNSQGVVLSVNPFGAEQLGYTVAEMVGQPILLFFHPGDHSAVTDQLAACLRKPGQIAYWEFRKVRKDGGMIWVREAARAVKRIDGSSILLIVCDDVTVRKQAEEQLRLLMEFNESIVQNMAEGLIAIDGQGSIAFVNSAMAGLLDYSPRELIGRAWTALIPFDKQTLVNELKAQAKTTGVGRYELELEKSDGSRVAVLASISQYLSEGHASGFLIVFTDLSERKHLEKQLLQAQKMEAIGRLAGGVAHDFNNLLTAILGFSELLLESFQMDDHRRQDLEEILKAAQHASALTRQLLAFSRRQVVQPQRMDLNSAVGNLEKMLRRLIGEDIEMQMTLGASPAFVNADPGQIEQILLNLVVNARDAMANGGKLIISTNTVPLDGSWLREHDGFAPGLYVILTVSDTGSGIEKEILSQIFEPFFTTKGEGKGTGLGLSTVYGIVKQSRGHIEVNSTLGQGATFKIYLPAVTEMDQIAQSGSITVDAGSSSETILIVEDEDRVRNLIRRILSSRGYKLLEASNGVEAVALSEQHRGPIHLLLTDVVLPEGMNGWELRNRLVALRPELKVLCISGYAYDAAVHRHISERDTPFLEKPFKPAVLAHKVRQVLNVP